MLMCWSAGHTVFLLMNVVHDSEIGTGDDVYRTFFTTQHLEGGVISVFELSGQIHDVRNASKLAPCGIRN